MPVVFDGIDEIGMELIGGVQEWIRWIAEKSGREEIVKLSATGGRESEVLEWASLVFWKPTFMMLHRRKSGLNVVMARDNVLTVLCDERKEVVFGRALPARETGRMRSVNVENRDKDQETDEEGEKERGDFSKGVPVDGEFAFTKAVGEFCRGAVRAGCYKWNYRFNLKGQMEQRAWIKGEKMEKMRIAIVGGSQMGRMKIVRMDNSLVDVEKVERMRGEVTDG